MAGFRQLVFDKDDIFYKGFAEIYELDNSERSYLDLQFFHPIS